MPGEPEYRVLKLLILRAKNENRPQDYITVHSTGS